MIIAARNAAGSIHRSLGSLADQTATRGSFEVIVVDDGSEDGTAAEAAGFDGVKVISAGRHVGLPAARNLGIDAASAPLLAFTDDDCVVDRRYIELGLERAASEPDAAILACRTVIPLTDAPGIAELLDAARHFDQEGYIQNGYAAGGSMWVRTADARAIGGFNDRLEAYGGEDYEFCRLLTSRGARIVYAPEVRQEHPPRRSLGELASKSWRLGKCFVAIRRHGRGPAPPSPLWARPWHLLPSPRVRGADRLSDRGVRVGPVRRAAMVVAQWVWLQVPFFFGELTGSLRRR